MVQLNEVQTWCATGEIKLPHVFSGLYLAFLALHLTANYIEQYQLHGSCTYGLVFDGNGTGGGIGESFELDFCLFGLGLSVIGFGRQGHQAELDNQQKE